MSRRNKSEPVVRFLFGLQRPGQGLPRGKFREVPVFVSLSCSACFFGLRAQTLVPEATVGAAFLGAARELMALLLRVDVDDACSREESQV